MPDDEGAVARVRDTVAREFTAAIVAHDISHLARVARLAARIAEAERADPVIAQVGAYVHDYHRILEAETGQAVIEPAAAWPRIGRVLSEAGVPAAWWPRIEEAVASTGGLKPPDGLHPVARAVHDADKLDALGAIGIARAFMYGGAIAEPMWDPSSIPAGDYRPGPTSSVIAHCYEKLVHLGAEMTTQAGRELAVERTRFLRGFLQRFHDEWAGAAYC